jgi:hypothetical protein
MNNWKGQLKRSMASVVSTLWIEINDVCNLIMETKEEVLNEFVEEIPRRRVKVV